MIKQFSFIILFLFLSCLQAQTIQPEHFTIEDGLSQGFVSALHQDNEGFLWMGTKNGLNRYDGNHFEVFTHDPSDPYSISGDWINSICEQGDFLLIGVDSDLLNIFHKKTKRFYKVPVGKNSTVQSGVYLNVFKDPIGQIWAEGSFTDTLYNFFHFQFPAHFWEKLPANEALLKEVSTEQFSSTIAVLGGTDLLINEEGQFFNMDLHIKKKEPVDTHFDFHYNKHGFTPFRNKVIFWERSGTMLHIYEQGNWRSISTDIPIYNLFVSEKTKQVWIQDYYNHQIMLFDEQSLSKTSFKREEANAIIKDTPIGINSFIVDQSGNTWMGTGGYGVVKISPRVINIKTLFKETSIYSPPLSTVEGEVLILNPPDEILYKPGASTRLASIRDYAHKNRHRKTRVQEDKDGAFWSVAFSAISLDDINAKNELTVYKLDSNGNRQKKTSVIGSFSISTKFGMGINKQNGDLLISRDGFLFRYTPASNDLQVFEIPQLVKGGNLIRYYSVTATANGHCWIGTSKGLVHATPNGTGYHFELIQAQHNGLLNNEVATLLNDPKKDHILWIGTKGGGLHRLDIRDKTFTYLTTKNGLPNDVIYGILNDEEGNLWMSSNKGIIRYHPESGLIRNFTKADGMQSNEFNTYAYSKGSNGALLFGGIKGLNVFHPKDLVDIPNLSKVQITGLEVNNSPVSIRDSASILSQAIEFTSAITLPFSKNNITLEFAAMEYTALERNRFRYYLEGAEAAWIHESADNRAPYLNLSPGDYTFKVKASNGDGLWNEEAAELMITILPPWYRSTLAYWMYALLLGLGVWQVLRFQRNRLQWKHAVEIEKKEADRLKELDGFKSKLYTNITHEFRTPLTVVMGMTERLKSAPSTTTLANAQKELTLIQRNGKNLFDLVNQILDLSKIEDNNLQLNYEQGNVIKYIRYIMESFHSLANAQNIILKLVPKQNEILMDYDPEKFRQILSNLLSNAIKYTPSGGKIEVEVDIAPPKKLAGRKTDLAYLNIKVVDTGAGIAEKDLPNIFNRFYQADNSIAKSGGTGIGLALTKELVKLIKGTIEVESELGKGTTFVLHLPINRNAALKENKQTRQIKSETSLSPIAPLIQEANLPNLLIIEDNLDVIEYLNSCLENQYQLDYAYNGRIGIEKALESVPDLIISDVMMPEKDGFEVCETLKNDERTSHIPIVLLTAKADVASRLDGLSRGADAYLGKPFHQKELLIRLQQLMKLRKRLQTRYAGLQKYIDSKQTANKPSEEDHGFSPLEDAFIKKIQSHLDKQLDRPDFGVPHLAQKMALSQSQLYRKIKALTNKSTAAYIRTYRLHKSLPLLQQKELTISEIAYEVGFSSLQYFSDAFYEEFGQRPSEISTQ